MIKVVRAMLKENGEWSFTRCIAFASFLAFLIASAYLIITGKDWHGYDTFAAVTGGGGPATQLVNKFINGKYNTPIGQAGKPMGGE